MAKKRQRGKQHGITEAKLARAVAAHQTGRQEETRQLCDEILNRDEHHAEARHLLGLVELSAGNFENAEQCFVQAILGAPKDARFHCNLGNALHRQGRHSEATDSYRRALRIDPRLADALVNLGNLLFDQEQWEQAEQQYHEAIRVAPNLPEAHYGLGVLLQAQKKNLRAYEAYLRATELAPMWGQAHNNLGRMHWQLARTEEAIASYLRASELIPDNSLVHRNLGESYFLLMRWEDSRRHFARAAKLDPSQEMARNMVDRLANGAPTDLPEDYVRNTFDNYADWFETHLTGTLKYRAPELLRHAVDVVGCEIPTPWKILDLGCGTGLCGAQFAPLASELIGSDLAPKMVEKCRNRNVYHELRTENLLDTLASFTCEVDLVVAGDVIIYMGNVGDVMQAAASALKQGGLFAFSTEREDHQEDWTISNGRYRHSDQWIQNLAAQHCLNVALSEPTVIRYEGGQPVSSQIYVLVNGPVPARRADWNPPTETVPVGKNAKDDRHIKEILDKALTSHSRDLLDDAETSYRQVLEIEPQHAQALHMLGALLDQRGNHREGIDLIRSSLEIDKENPSTYNSLGNALAAIGELDAAVEAYQEAIGRAPHLAHLHCRLGEVLLKMDRRDEAEQCVQRGLNISPQQAKDFAHLVEAIARGNKE